MLFRTLFVPVVAAASLAGIAGAHAAPLIDFTDTSVWSGSGAGATSGASYGDVVVSLSSNPVNSLNFTEAYDGPASPVCAVVGGPLACGSDGLGIVDDEITNENDNTVPPSESVTVDFTASVGGAVNVLGFHFLDLFYDPNALTQESARIYANGVFVTEIFASEAFQNLGGYHFVAYLLSGVQTLTFAAGSLNDGQGGPDYALAAIDVAPIPLPAAGWLLLGGLGILGASRRRRAQPTAA